MMNLWDVFVEQVFGSFWMAVIALSLIILIILWMGNISAWTSMAYVTMFIFALAIGYGPALITIILFIGLLSWAVFEILQYYNTSSR